MAGLLAVGLVALRLGAIVAFVDDDVSQLPDSVTQAAVQAASDQLGVPTDNLALTASVQRDWPDSSLGCPQPGHAYSQIVTPGYIVTVDTMDSASEVLVHLNGDGSVSVIC